jgi:hypothetical protein
VAADDDRLRPVRHDPRHVLADDRLTKDRAADAVAQRAVRRRVHPGQVELVDERLVGGDVGAFDADAVLLDRVGRVDRWVALGGSI